MGEKGRLVTDGNVVRLETVEEGRGPQSPERQHRRPTSGAPQGPTLAEDGGKSRPRNGDVVKVERNGEDGGPVKAEERSSSGSQNAPPPGPRPCQGRRLGMSGLTKAAPSSEPSRGCFLLSEFHGPAQPPPALQVQRKKRRAGGGDRAMERGKKKATSGKARSWG